ncbi:MAG: DUF2269 domain-containing protein [Candidatus Schekmanbacteria bacterium]|nr:DUF2269 domain-containing protein [Candidatus Schekmanbacteria bacterium]
MGLYIYLKVLHVIAATMFFGTGLGSAFYKLRADLSGKTEDIVFAQKNIVLADWLFTVPSGVVLPVTGLWMAELAGFPIASGWMFWGLILYGVAGACWLPAAVLQIRMRDEAIRAFAERRPLAGRYVTWSRIWLLLGIPAFAAAVITIFLMVAKAVPW